jgi:hypothetical protein
VFQAKGDATGPPRKGESKVSSNSVKKAEEKKRHERRLSVSASVKQESVDKKKEEEANSGDHVNPLPQFFLFLLFGSLLTLLLPFPAEATEVKDKAPDDGVPAKMDAEGDQAASGEDKEKSAKATDGVKKEGVKRHSRELSREKRGRHRSVGSSHYSHHSRSPASQRRGSRHHASPSRKPGVLTFAQIRVSSGTPAVHPESPTVLQYADLSS